MDSIYQFGIDFILFLQGLGDWIFPPMQFFTFLGDEEFFLLVTPILYWCFDTRIGIRTAIMLMLSSGVYNLGKWLFHTPRPYWISNQVRIFRAESSFGMPSGHATSAVSVWGYLAASFRKTWFWAVAISVMILIGLSRLVLSVHFPHDVLLGWVLGSFILIIYLRLEDRFGNWMQNRSTSQKVAYAFLASLGLVLLALLVVIPLSNDPLPSIWLENAALAFPQEPPLNPYALSSQITVAGTLFGLATGHILLFAGSGYNTTGKWWQHLLRYFLGIAGVVIIWAGLDQIFPEGATLLPYIFRYIRYGLVGFWVTFLAPKIFIKVNIARSRS
jgi:membrane-associated phospholipid phosphatase